jgi:hypothetical protein
MKLENSLLFDHDPGDPRIGHGEQKEQSDDGTSPEAQELDAEGEGQENASREDVDGPFETHANAACSLRLYLRCFVNSFSQSCCLDGYPFGYRCLGG